MFRLKCFGKFSGGSFHADVFCGNTESVVTAPACGGPVNKWRVGRCFVSVVSGDPDKCVANGGGASLGTCHLTHVEVAYSFGDVRAHVISRACVLLEFAGTGRHVYCCKGCCRDLAVCRVFAHTHTHTHARVHASLRLNPPSPVQCLCTYTCVLQRQGICGHASVALILFCFRTHAAARVQTRIRGHGSV